jgi:hypothetical protein
VRDFMNLDSDYEVLDLPSPPRYKLDLIQPMANSSALPIKGKDVKHVKKDAENIKKSRKRK